MSPPTAAASSARQVLQRRAIQCSFSSVFHLRNCAASTTAMKEAKNAERIFFRAVALPVYAMGIIGVVAYGHKQWK